jgi:hypothetical protein
VGLGDADVVHPVGELGPHYVEAASWGHGRGERVDAGVGGGERSEGRRKMSLKVARAGGGFLEAKFFGLGSLSAQV